MVCAPWQRVRNIGSLTSWRRKGDAFGVVWSLPPARAQEVIALSAESFTSALQDVSHGVAGNFELISERASWSLQLAHVKQWAGTFAEGGAWVLAGDAAHSIHPLAGLGLNLGIADAVELAQVLRCAKALTIGAVLAIAIFYAAMSAPAKLAFCLRGQLRWFATFV